MSMNALTRRKVRNAVGQAAGNDLMSAIDNPDTNRCKATQGTAHVAGDYALSGGFGTTASVAVATGSNDSRGRITITSAGTGQGANPTCTLTFKDGAWPAAPIAVVCRGGGSQNTIPVDVTTTTTTMVITFRGTPVAAETYVINYTVEG